MEPKAIVTMNPYAPYLDEVLKHPIVSGVRLNTVMRIKRFTLEDKLKEFYDETRKFNKEFWVDLKGRQLRTLTYRIPPFNSIKLSHKIKVNTPCKAYFDNGEESATVLEVDGNQLIMQEGPERVIGPGESVNIPDASLSIEGYLTYTDKKYIEAGNKIDFHNYMISFVESLSDRNEIYNLDPKANIIEKIESRKGLYYVKNSYDGKTRLMAARGDLFIELRMPHEVVKAVEEILEKDKNAVAASRIFSSLNKYNLEPKCEDINDIDNLLRIGYRTFMLGDDICMNRDSLISGLNLLYTMTEKYRK